MNVNRTALVRKVAHWTLPPGIQKLALDTISHNRLRSLNPVLQRNKVFLNRHAGERCFILATGPSIRDQDLTPLREEWCFAVSEFYKHRHYDIIRPAYYCQAPSHYPFTEEDMRRRLDEMKQHCEDAVFFFGLSDRDLLTRARFTASWERVHYLQFCSVGFRSSTIDLTKPLPGPQSASLIAIWAAIYMGFSEIYLIGCDHNVSRIWDGSWRYPSEHFYDGAPTIGHQTVDLDEALRAHLRLREQYRWTNQIAVKHGTKLIHANPWSYLDVLPKVPLETLLSPVQRG